MDHFEIVSEYKPTLFIANNKTLAGQLYGEFKEFFPNNAVEYFVSCMKLYYLPLISRIFNTPILEGELPQIKCECRGDATECAMTI